jgi:hypothetical protein
MINYSILKLVRENWLIFVFIVGIIMAWTNFERNDVNAENRLNIVESQIAKTNDTQDVILTKLSAIETDLQWIRQKIQ